MYFAANDAKPIVAIPVRNEAERLPALLNGLAAQTWLERSDERLKIVLVLNNCDDGSAEVVKATAAGLANLSLDIIDVEFRSDDAHVGSARRMAMDRALEIGGANSVLLTTDADAVPMPNWIEANLRAIEEGADIVGGHIIGDKAEEALLGSGFRRRAAKHLYYARLIDRLATLIDPVAHDPWPRHSDHTGASLAVRGEVYTATGGIPRLPFREDIAFVTKVCQAGYRLRHPLDVQVVVSARLEGRAAGGMADCLKTWVAAEEKRLPHLVEDPNAVAQRLRGQRDVSPILPPQGDTSSDQIDARTDIETAIKRIERMIAGKGDEVHVT
jgi:GT2 family glycosyltransferase